MKNNMEENMLCPLCGETHHIRIISRESHAIIKGENISFPMTVYVCDYCDDENEFIPSGVMDKNLMAARDAYRTVHNLLTSKEIISLRNKYGLSQKELARMLGWGDVTISRYETKYIQDETHDDLLRMISKDPLVAKEYLTRNKVQFEEERYTEILSNIERAIADTGAMQYRKKSLEAQYLKFEANDNLTGKAAFNLAKICDMIDYFARHCKNLYKVKLMKLLWYSDALSYKIHGHAISGLVYQHKPMGALPIGHYELIALVPHEEIIEEQEYLSYRILPFEDVREDSLSAEDIEILSMVFQEFGSFNGIELADHMHNEIAYTQTAENAYIPFTLAERIRRPGEACIEG